MQATYLLIGLGNPGVLYDKTRHNVGMRAVRFFAEKKQQVFQKEKSLKANVCAITEERQSIVCVLPTTYMNESGQALQKCQKHFKVPVENILIVVDDADLPFGTMRLKEKGSSAGHNGLKSIEQVLQTRDYSRLRIGIGRDPYISLDTYVLDRFTEEEETSLKDLWPKSLEIIKSWIKERDKKYCLGENHEKTT